MPGKTFIFYFFRSLLLLLALITFNPHHSYSQGSNIKFKHLSLREGLSQSTVNCMFQDEKGFMWFGTQDGLNRFNGYDFTVYKNTLGDSSTISNGYINAIIQYKDELWIATNKGLNIFNFHNEQFHCIDSSSNGLIDDVITSLHLDKDSNVWIGTNKGVIKYNHDNSMQRIALGKKTGVSQIVVTDIISDLDNNIWVSTENAGLLIYDNEDDQLSPFTKTQTFNDELKSKINCLSIDRSGDIYIGSEQHGLLIWLYEDQKMLNYSSSYNYLTLSSNNVTSVYQDNKGVIWVGTSNKGLNKFLKHKGVFYSFTRRVNDESSLSSNNVKSLFEDRTGVLWIGTELGINYFDLLKQNFNHYQTGNSTINNISGNIVWSIFQDENGLIWIGTNEGLITLDRESNVFNSFPPSISVDGEKKNTSIYAIYQDSRSRLWLGTDGGLYRFDKNSSRYIYHSPSSNTSRTYVIFEDSKSRIWAGTKNGVVVLSPGGSLLYRLKVSESGSNGLPNPVIRAIIEDDNGNFWIGTDGGLSRVNISQSGQIRYKNYKKESEKSSTLSNNTILSLCEDNKGFLWIGTFGGGLNRFDKENESFIYYTQRDGLPNNVIYGILRDNQNKLWLSTNRGLCSFSIAEKAFHSFDESDGLQSNEFNVGAYFKSKNGELFFGGIKGFNSFFPSSIRQNEIKPQLVLTEFELFNQPVEIGPNSVLKKHISEIDQIKLSYADNVFSFGFAALHYSMPEKNRYAYKMEGFDENWIYDNTRQAKYTNLDPDNYVFKVKATNSDGIWGDEISVDVIITPPFWQIKWVWALAIFIIGFSSFTYYRSRIKRIKAQKAFLEKQVKERTKELIGKNEEVEKQKGLLEEERDKLETLLLNILPQSTVEELKKKGKAKARNYRMATVMFTDFKNFTKISETLSPTELVEKLDGFFVKFDEIIERFNVEKIKTIGDAYMCAGGIPIRNKSNPIDVVLASLEIQRTVTEIAESAGEDETKWGLRLGIHTGNLVAGVIGIKRFAYDIWGDTVNVASRVESGGEVGRVNVSGQTYELIKEFFICEYRGKIHAKNKGEIDMYFVNSIKPELSVKGEGLYPNQAFWEYVNLFTFSNIKYRELESFMVDKLNKELDPDLYYHSVAHTLDVCNEVERIAHMEGVLGEDIFILKAAALFHDAGYTKKYGENEEIGTEMAREILPKYGFEDEQVEKIEKLILSTFVEREPQSELERIIRDADLDYLGRDDFEEISTKLKKELLDKKIISDDIEWDRIQIDFISKHRFYTNSEIELREEKKKENLQAVKDRLNTKIEETK